MAAGFWKRLLSAAMGEGRPNGREELSQEEARPLQEQGYVRRHYYFSGRVQEVGFRYTAFALSSRLGLTGWVLNLPDGRVEMEVQGKAETVDLLLVRLGSAGRISIEQTQEEDSPLCREERFEVIG